VLQALQQIPVWPMEKTMVEQVVPLQHTKDHARQDINTVVCGGLHTAAGGCALKETAARGEPTQEQVLGRNSGP